MAIGPVTHKGETFKMMGRKTYEITGYADTENGVVYCLNCLEEGDKEKFTPICLGDEWDEPGPACDNCHTLIEIDPIHYEKD